MFKLFKHKFDHEKQNFSTIVRRIDGITEDVLNPLSLNKEGVFGIEAHFNKLGNTYLIVSPSHYTDVEGNETIYDYHMLTNSKNDLHCYSIEFEQPSFLPIKLEELSLWNYFEQLPKIEMFVQFLIYNTSNDWKEMFTDQYIHYLMGNDFPLNNKIARNVQTKVLRSLNKIAQFDLNRERNHHIEYKIKDNGYRFNMRLIIHSKDIKKVRIMEHEIHEILSLSDFYNQLKLYREEDKETFLYNYTNRIMDTSSNQILSETELFSLFMGEVEMKQEIIIPKTEVISKLDYPGLTLLPKNEQPRKEVNPKIGESIIQAIRELGMAKNKHLEIVSQTRSATLQKVTMNIPKGVKYSDIEKNYKDMKAILGYEVFTIDQGDEPGTVTFSIPCEDRDIVFLRDLLESSEYKKAAKDMVLPIIVGLDTNGDPLIIDLASLPHLIVAGATGGGKSYFLNCIILTLLIMKNTNEIKLYLIDPKRVEFTNYKGFPQIKNRVVTDPEEAVQLLDSICIEMDYRYEMFSEAGVRDIKGYNKKFPQKKIPYVVTIIDEIADLMMVSDNKVEEYIVRLSQLARAAGIHIILATQRPEVKVITGIIKSNIESRIAFSVSSGTDSRIILDENGAEKLLGKGDGLAKIKGQKKNLIRFQSPVIALEDEKIEGILVGLKNVLGEDNEEEEFIESVPEEPEEEPIDKLRNIIKETGECRIPELQKLMRIRINTIKELMQELVNEGFLTREGRSYKISE